MTTGNIFQIQISLVKASVYSLKKRRGVKKDIAQSLCCTNCDLNGFWEQRPLLKYVRFPLIHRQIHGPLDLQNE